VAKITARELAELVPCPLEHVSRLHDLGILESGDDDGLYSASDVHLVRLMAAFEEAGISLEDVARGVAEGELSFPLGLFLPEPVPRSETYEGLAAALERSPELLRRLSRELGLPPASDDRVRAEDAEVLSLVVRRLDLADENELSRFARLYGGTVQRLVSSGLDEAAAELASDLASVVQESSRTHGGRPVKWLGDGVMFHFSDPAAAIRGGLALVEETEKALSVPARIGINSGAVIVQEGDYFGRTVNVAARIAEYAKPHEVLVSDEAKRNARVADVEFELVGDVPLKGVSTSVRLHRARRA
jgi:class 3 adenylate cyclase